jgi:L-malate glycosyltransferase
MNILHTVESYWPSVGGAQEVVKQISERLARKGHSVTVATSRDANRQAGAINGVQVREFDVSGNQTLGIRGEADVYQRFLLEGRFDIMMNYAAQQWSADLVYPILDRIPYRKVLAPCGFSGLYERRYQQYFKELPSHLMQYDQLVFHSNTYRDIQFARGHGINHYSVIPNAACEEEFASTDNTFRQRHDIPGEMPFLLSVCNHTRAKGHALVMEAFRQAHIGPAVLVIIGKPIGRTSCLPICQTKARLVALTSRGRKRVLLLDAPRSETLAAYKAADLFLFGSRLECSPLVLFEAVASRTPFISSACGNADEIVAWTDGGVIVPGKKNGDGTVSVEPQAMARMVEKLVADEPARTRMADAGFNAWRDRFTWDRITDEYEQLYRALIS